MITPEDKDAFLLSLTSKADRGFVTVDHKDFGRDIDEHVFLSIIEEFEERGFVKLITATEMDIPINLTPFRQFQIAPQSCCLKKAEVVVQKGILELIF